MEWKEEVYHWCQQYKKQKDESVVYWYGCEAQDTSTRYGLPEFMNFYTSAYPNDIFVNKNDSVKTNDKVYTKKSGMTFSLAEDIVPGLLHHFTQTHKDVWHYVYFKWNHHYYFNVWYSQIPIDAYQQFATMYDYLYTIRNELQIYLITDILSIILSYVDIHPFLKSLHILNKETNNYHPQ